MLMLNSKILVGISLAVWNSFAAYQVARSTANGAMGDPKTYGYGFAFWYALHVPPCHCRAYSYAGGSSGGYGFTIAMERRC